MLDGPSLRIALRDPANLDRFDVTISDVVDM
jgi:hypothetical protein